MKQFTDLVRHIKEHGVYKSDRTGTGTYSVFGYQMRFDLTEGFPVVTEKATHLKSVIHELLWFLQGDTNIRYLKANGVSIWDEWVDPDTAVYEDLTQEELIAAIKKKLEVETVEFDVKNGETSIRYSSDHTKAVVDIDHQLDVASGPVFPTLQYTAEFLGLSTTRLVAGALGPVYGYQWRSWPDVKLVEHDGNSIKTSDMLAAGYKILHMGAEDSCATYERGVDQIKNVVEMIKTNPDSRRLIVSAWNPAQVDVMALPPCHALFQFYSEPLSYQARVDWMSKNNADLWEDWVGDSCTDEEAMDWMTRNGVPVRKLSCQLYQRSADVFLGVPFNIASYALLTHMVAHVTGHAVGDFIWTGGDCHLYSNHMEQVDLLLSREALPLPALELNKDVKDIFAFTYDDIKVHNYQCHPAIKAPVAV